MSLHVVHTGHDTWVSSLNNDTNYGDDDKISLNGATRQGFIWFRRPFTPGAIIAGATLWLYLKGGGWVGAHVITGKIVQGTWDEGELDWDHRPGVSGTHAATLNILNGVDGQLVGLPITAMMQDVANGATYFGIRLEVDTTGVASLYSLQADSSLQPYLEVDWSEAPDVPRNLSPSGGRAVATSKPLLQWEYRDEDGESSQASSQVQIAADVAGAPGAWTTYDSTKVANTVSEWDLALTAFGGLAAGIYWWRLKTWDDNDNPSDWSDPVQFAFTAKSVLTITNPPAAPNNFVEETTPPFAFTFGGTLKSARARLLVDDMLAPTFARPSTAVKLDGSTVPSGSPRFEGGRFGQSITIGSDAASPDTLTLPLEYIDNDGDGTIEVFGYISSLSNPPADRYLYELDGGNRLGLRRTTTGHYIAKANGATAIDYNPAAPLAIGWHLFALRWSGTAIALFVDGVQVGSATLAGAVSFGTATVLFVGSNGSGASQWNSQLDELRISARSHDDDEISGLFTSGSAPLVLGDTIAYLSFDNDLRVDGQGGEFGDQIWHWARSPGLVSPFRPPAGKLQGGGRKYQIEIAAWDNIARADGPVIATRTFTLRRSSVPAAVDTLTVADNGDGSVTIDVFRAATPDHFGLKVDGKLVEDNLPIDTSLVAPGHWRFVYWRLSFRTNTRHVIEAVAVVNDAGVMKISKHNPTKVVRPSFAGIALVAPDAVGPVLIFDRNQPDFVLGEDATAFRLLNRRDMVTVTNSVGGLEGSVTGTLIDTAAATAEQYSDRLNRMKALSRHEELRLVYPRWMNIRVRLGPGLKNNGTPDGAYLVEIPFHQVDDFAVQAPG